MTMINQSIHFNRSLKRLSRKRPEIIPSILEKIILFSFDKNHPSLSLHKLTGTLKDHWAFSIEYNLRVVFKYASDGNIVLIDIGTHDEVY